VGVGENIKNYLPIILKDKTTTPITFYVPGGWGIRGMLFKGTNLQLVDKEVLES